MVEAEEEGKLISSIVIGKTPSSTFDVINLVSFTANNPVDIVIVLTVLLSSLTNVDENGDNVIFHSFILVEVDINSLLDV